MSRTWLRVRRLLAAASGLLAGTALAAPPENAVWVEAKDLSLEGQGWTDVAATYDRLPARAEAVVRPPVWDLSRDSAGLCANFVTDSPRLYLRWELNTDHMSMAHMPATGMSGVDIYAKLDTGWRFVGNGQPRARQSEAEFWLPKASAYRAYFPLYNGITSLTLAAEPGHSLTAAPPSTRPLVVFYGTSILQGGCASRPGLAAVARTGRDLDIRTINLGFSGNALSEPEMQELVAELPGDVFVLDPLWNMKPEEVRDRIPPFVRLIRAKHPTAPIVLVGDTQVFNQVPTDKQTILHTAFEQLRAEGIGGLSFLSAEGMLGTDGEGTVDGVHPNDIGFERQAAKYDEGLRPIIEALTAQREPPPAAR